MDPHENAPTANARAAAESAKHAATAAGLAEIDAKKAAACDLVAKIHEGEAIVPKAYNPWAGGGGGSDNAQLLQELRALRAEVAQLKAATQAGADAAGATADVLVRVTNNGNGMVTAAAPI